MLRLLKNTIKKSQFVQRVYWRYLHPHLSQYELETYILRNLKFDQCVDVGANVGIYNVLLSRQCNCVYAFEPVRYSFEMLKTLHVQNVRVYNLALGSLSGKMDISFPTIGGKSAWALATLRSLTKGHHAEIVTQEVDVLTFDEFEGQIDFDRIDFVKIDVEGFEMDVLRGMKRLVE